MSKRAGTIYTDARTGMLAAAARVQDLRAARPAVCRLRTVLGRAELQAGDGTGALEPISAVTSARRASGAARRGTLRSQHAAVRVQPCFEDDKS